VDAAEREDIRDLLARYNQAIDFGDADGWVACFTPEGVFECTGLPEGSPLGGRYEGAEALHGYAVSHYGIFRGRARHWNDSLVVDGDSDEATMSCYMLALSVGRGLVGTTGVYRDRLRKVDGQWRFVHRHIAIDPPPST
jgi:ketosteroid isomerase-like protein